VGKLEFWKTGKLEWGRGAVGAIVVVAAVGALDKRHNGTKTSVALPMTIGIRAGLLKIIKTVY